MKRSVTCLHCWAKFRPEDVLWQSVHVDLRGDPLLGDDAQLRFLPSRFTVDGKAIDGRGQKCFELACPFCHLTIPRSLLDWEPLFVSILGSPSCGKSFFLAAMTTTLRKELPSRFLLDFRDADTVGNRTLSDYEDRLFMCPDPDSPVFMGDLIPKTELNGYLYNRVRYGRQEVSYPRPFSFLIGPGIGHPARTVAGLKRLVCLYDNAGEHFIPGSDSASAPGTRHMAESSFLVFLYDPTQDPRWIAALKKLASSVEVPPFGQSGRQEQILWEAASRIQRMRGLVDGEKYGRPLVVVINKMDVWRSLAPGIDWQLPYDAAAGGAQELSMSRVSACSATMRGLLVQHVPDIVYAAEAFAKHVWYLPSSSLGRSPQRHQNGQYYLTPSQIRPEWVNVPFMLGLSLTTNGLVTLSRGSEPH